MHPDRFTERLLEVNNARDARVVPLIKLAKAIADCFIKDSSGKISGYHMESLAIDAFTGYEGELDSRSMLVHFLGHSMKAVMSPIDDFTGQSSFVDEYLGQADSGLRKRASTHFGQMRGKVNSSRTKAEFDDLLCGGSCGRLPDAERRRRTPTESAEPIPTQGDGCLLQAMRPNQKPYEANKWGSLETWVRP